MRLKACATFYSYLCILGTTEVCGCVYVRARVLVCARVHACVHMNIFLGWNPVLYSYQVEAPPLLCFFVICVLGKGKSEPTIPSILPPLGPLTEELENADSWVLPQVD